MTDLILTLILGLACGAMLGGILAWFLLKTRALAARATELATLRERLTGKDQELQKLQEIFNRESAEHRLVREEHAQVRAELEGERRASQERTEMFRTVIEELSERFKALSRDALKDNNQSFLELAHATLGRFQESAKGDLEQRQKAIDQLVKPLKESLEKVDGKIGEIEKARASAYSALCEQVKALASSQSQLQTETGNLVKALRTPHVRGRWGEIQLRRVVELAGMLQYCDFVEQETVTTEDTRIRPDVIVRLPGSRTIVIDSKVPFEAFYESISTTNEETRLLKVKEHARLVRAHITSLSRKSYWETVQPTPEFVLLFLPGETFYSAALENDPKLIEDGVDQGVIIATPTTLIALLKAVAYGWRQEQMARNAVDVARLGKDLYDRLRTFTNYFSDIGKGLERALESYNRGVGSLEARVLVAARRFKEHGALAGDEIDSIDPIDKTVRSLHLDEGGLFPEADLAEGGVAEEVAPLFSAHSAGEK
jgi:DNA recombination protein RmuC